jgi:hypothetical protein
MEISVKGEGYSIDKTLNLAAEFKLINSLDVVQQVADSLLEPKQCSVRCKQST